MSRSVTTDYEALRAQQARQQEPATCICYWTDQKYWTTHYGAVEPGSTMEPNPDCKVHF
ncbi:hypothetical protein ACVWZ8_004349 [Arthrobacter sp. UYCu723]